MDLIRFKFVCYGIFANTISTKDLHARLIQTLNDAWRPLFLLLTGTYNIQRKMTGSALSMDEGTLKTPIPKCRLYWSILFGVVKQICRFWIWSVTECKTPAEYGLQHNATPPYSLPSQPHTVFTTELQRLLSGVHSVMRVKLALAGEGGGCTPTPFITFNITSYVAVYAPAEWADTLTLFHLL